jgi:hypothetical protein
MLEIREVQDRVSEGGMMFHDLSVRLFFQACQGYYGPVIQLFIVFGVLMFAESGTAGFFIVNEIRRGSVGRMGQTTFRAVRI